MPVILGGVGTGRGVFTNGFSLGKANNWVLLVA